ncbi:Hdr-like menaquinol oxidoreductase cytochrome c subunit [Parasulfuritortus cantonensis]|uniref:Hdr-like menaquinol oxidoreductase cytochrome c subunit n=1 Tax=Parasulfuritortus cantonensis TaxID=2528202 RepID=UPI0014055582|nr:Hdr-like menaquinol oxidoreductase cytochrome c subunit [Parasulfuritortus cantonensis]
MKGMARLGRRLRLAALLGVSALFVAHTPMAAAGVDKPEPVIAKAKTEHCIRDEDFMIRHHPDLLKHQRDDTLRRGIRSGDFSLKRCMECHSNNAADHAAIKTDCDSCHAYAAVQLDCWDCHAKRPAKAKAALEQPASPSPMMTSVQPGEQKQ